MRTIAPVAGVIYLPFLCDAGPPRSVIAFHGTDDGVLPYGGGPIPGSGCLVPGRRPSDGGMGETCALRADPRTHASVAARHTRAMDRLRRRHDRRAVHQSTAADTRGPARCRSRTSARRPTRSVPRTSCSMRSAVSDLVRGSDGRHRCRWGASTPDYESYHDEEWGRPVVDDIRIYEKLCLEGFQSGLSWLTILRKREGFRHAFAGFDPAAVARFGDGDVERLLADASIVRHRGKIEATIANARATLGVQDDVGSLGALVWSFEPNRTRPAARCRERCPMSPRPRQSRRRCRKSCCDAASASSVRRRVTRRCSLSDSSTTTSPAATSAGTARPRRTASSIPVPVSRHS